MEATWGHVAISVRDIDETVRFYRDVLGFAVDWDMDNRSGEELSRVVDMPDANARIVMMKGYGTRLELFKWKEPQSSHQRGSRQCDHGITHFALSVKNIQDIYPRLVEAGARFNCPPQKVRPGVWATYMKDPEGNTIEIIEYSDQ